MAKTLYDKLWSEHVVKWLSAQEALLYVDRHLVQEVSSPQAFASLNQRGLTVRRPNANLALADHAVPTKDRQILLQGLAAKQVARLKENAAHFGVPYLDLDHDYHGIVHVIGPELGFTLPGATLACGDSHTSTHGAFGVLAFGIGTSECSTLLASQVLKQKKMKNMRIKLDGALSPATTSKDIMLALIREIGTDGGQGFAIEFFGSTIATLSMEARMTICNMAIEAGARIGLIAPDETTFAYLKDKSLSPKGALWARAVSHWRTLRSDEAAVFDNEVSLDVSAIEPHVTWGTTPADSLPISASVPRLSEVNGDAEQESIRRKLAYMGLREGQSLQDITINKAFIGSCTNARLEDLRAAAKVAEGRKVSASVHAIVVPGSAAVKAAAEREGLDRIFRSAGFEWRDPGCSMCVAMNNDRLKPSERCASTSNRNFEGRQGPDGRTHLMSPAMVAAAAISGRLVDIRELEG